MRRYRIVLLLFIACIAGCITTHSRNDAVVSQGINQTMAQDAVNRLAALYSPAHTRFRLMQPTKDAFGVSLVQLLRKKGYSVVESTFKGASSEGLALRYVVDASRKRIPHRVTLIIGEQSLRRAYVLKNDVLHPVGVWVRQELVR